jgi:hypothetical protein
LADSKWVLSHQKFQVAIAAGDDTGAHAALIERSIAEDVLLTVSDGVNSARDKLTIAIANAEESEEADGAPEIWALVRSALADLAAVE